MAVNSSQDPAIMLVLVVIETPRSIIMSTVLKIKELLSKTLQSPINLTKII